MKKNIMALIIMLALFFTQSAVLAMADSAEGACLINAVTGEVIFSKNMNTQHQMASTTKIMTAILAIENCDMDDIVTVSANAANQEGSAAYIEAGDEVYMGDMLKGLMLNSGNDAAVAIAEHISGSVEEFAKLMNKKAFKMGLKDTCFANPSGLDAPNHYTTAKELAFIAKYAMNIPLFREIVSQKTAQAKVINSDRILYFSNHNKLLSTYEGSTGIKTGFTKSTGRCLVSSAKRDDMEFIAVTLGDPNDWKDHTDMLDAAFAQHYPKNVVSKGMTIKTAKIDGKSYSMVAAEDFIMPFKENGRVVVDVVTHIAEDLSSPINAGEKVGYLDIRYNDASVGTVNIISKTDIYGISPIRLKNSFFSSFINVVKIILI